MNEMTHTRVHSALQYSGFKITNRLKHSLLFPFFLSVAQSGEA